MKAGTLDPAKLLSIRQLVMDEYQDLNPTDLEFVDHLIGSGVIVFVAGDDDQSIYSFRYASPIGIQAFLQRHPNAGDHQLSDCFRSTPNILAAGQTLIANFSDPTRLIKKLTSLYGNAVPPEYAIVHTWQFQSGVQKAKSIAVSCMELIKAGLPPSEIMILLSDTKALFYRVLHRS